MIKMMGTINEREVIALGLSDGNLANLRKGEPIHIFGAEIGTGFDIIIFWGETEAKLVEMVQPLLRPDTVIRDQQSEKKN